MDFPTGFDKITGHEYAKKCLLGLCDDNRPNTMIFVGPKGVGKLSAAVEYALMLLCENPTENGACYSCHSCKSYEKGLNPNIAFWYQKGQNTTIDQMRKLKSLAGFAPINSKYKVNIIQDADTLNEEASNSILKIMEEPPDYLINILIYNNPANILPTLRSRAYVMNFFPLAKESIYECLKSAYFGKEEHIIEFASRYAMGSLGRGKLLMETTNLDEIRDLMLLAVDTISNPCAMGFLAEKFSEIKFVFAEAEKEVKNNVKGSNIRVDRVVSVENMSDEDLKSNEQGYLPKPSVLAMSGKDNILEILDMLALYLRDLSIINLGDEDLSKSQIINIDKVDILKSQEKSFGDIEGIKNAINIIWNTKEKINGNVNLNLCLESMFSRIIFSEKGF